LAWALNERIASGSLRPGDKLPSVRELAAEAGVNVNTARAVYARLEREGLIRSEQGRGTFVAAREQPSDDAALRRDLRRRIAMLEAELVRRPKLPAEAAAEGRGGTGRLATTEELSQIHDDLLARLQRLDADRADIVRRIEELRAAASIEEPAAAPSEKRSSASLKGARVRWVGA
jgi:DNA-binding transcriptional regulator YhcF (GntR family)